MLVAHSHFLTAFRWRYATAEAFRGLQCFLRLFKQILYFFLVEVALKLV